MLLVFLLMPYLVLTLGAFVVSAIVRVVDVTANAIISAGDSVAFGTTAAIVSHFTFSSDPKDTTVLRLNILPHPDPFFHSMTYIYPQRKTLYSDSCCMFPAIVVDH